MLTPSPYPYSWLWTYAGDKNFEAEGEIKFSPVYAHDLLLLKHSSRFYTFMRYVIIIYKYFIDL